MINKVPASWPWPADTTLERARRVAQIYRHAYHALAPDDCAQLDRQMTQSGQSWVAPAVSIHEASDLLTAELAAEEMRVARRTIYAWRERGLPVVETTDGPRYRVDALRAFAADQRRRRINRAR